MHIIFVDVSYKFMLETSITNVALFLDAEKIYFSINILFIPYNKKAEIKKKEFCKI